MATKRYTIWHKKSPVITPIGEVLSPEPWIERYPIAGLDSITVICAQGEVNGAYFGTLGQMKQMYENNGADFSACTTNEEVLEAIEAFEDAQAELAAQGSDESTPEERIAAALEYQNILNTNNTVVNTDDPDLE